MWNKFVFFSQMETTGKKVYWNYWNYIILKIFSVYWNFQDLERLSGFLRNMKN